MEDQDEYQGGDRTPDQVDMLRERSKSYLGLHVIVGGAILGKIFVCLHFILFHSLYNILPVCFNFTF